jgi:hypothetical protein
MTNRPLQRISVAGGIAAALFGLYLASQTAHEFGWDAAVAIAIMVVGAFFAIIGLVSLIDADDTPEEIATARERSVLPSSLVPIVFGCFVVGVSVVAALVVGHYAGRNEGLMTFILAFVLANLVFGLGLWLGRQPSYR